MNRTTILLSSICTCIGALVVLYKLWITGESFPDHGAEHFLNDLTHIGGLNVSLRWWPPDQTPINDLTHVLDGTGVHGFTFDGSDTTRPSGIDDWCNMPHVRTQEYVRPPEEYELRYVEVIHRHHKRTPYAANTFPREVDTWDCKDEALAYYGALQPAGDAVAIGWQVCTSSANPMVPLGFEGTCQFPQITAGGLVDSRRHGRDLFGVYHDLLGFLPEELNVAKVMFRVTNNQITSQVASQVVYGMYPLMNRELVRVLVQPNSVDSLEPKYPCDAATNLFSAFGVESRDSRWLRHLRATKTEELLSRLDSTSGIDKSDDEWHVWFDHYYDNLSSRMCHQKLLPCSNDTPVSCVSQADADAVFRRGMYEYSFIYRDSAELFNASVASYGIWLAELAANLRNVMEGKDEVIYRHNIAHDGSISRLLSILQVNVMVWPGMGSEIVFELYEKETRWYLRVLWGGRVFVSTNPTLESMDLLPVDVFLAYVDGLAGVGAKKVPDLCALK